mmetsp:Transcript_102704/g.162391  ORF Transcript_102704/g.162391 Transcript_102704/m.162391 type:complete len:82 (-) Transcript_102704:791-1036(-)
MCHNFEFHCGGDDKFQRLWEEARTKAEISIERGKELVQCPHLNLHSHAGPLRCLVIGLECSTDGLQASQERQCRRGQKASS